MSKASYSAIRVLQLMMAASLVLPAVLFAISLVLSYRAAQTVADERIERSVDVLHEHALKVFQTVERSIAEVDALTRGMSDDQIRDDDVKLYARLKTIVAALPQIQTIAIVDRDGRGLISSTALRLESNVSDRAYFAEHIASDIGTYIGEALIPRTTLAGDRLVFNMSRRRFTEDASFTGIILVALRPQYFEEFYARIGRTPGSYYALLRDDGTFLARFPSLNERPLRLNASSALLRQIADGARQGLFTVQPEASQIDGRERRIGFRKIDGFPAYVQAGTETSAITEEWLDSARSQLLFGLPLTIVLFFIIGLALQRTQRLHVEAERREAAEAALRQSQRLEAIGQLTGGVAHDFNNLLMVVNGSVDRLRRDLPDPRHIRLLDMITNASSRGESLTRQLLAFSRQQTLMPAVVDLRAWLPDLQELLGRSLRGDIEIRTRIPAEPCAVKVDPNELELSLLNIAVNARDAMPDGGVLTIAIRPVVLRGGAENEGLTGDFVELAVSDTGTGISPDVAARVFEPFFTTKEFGKGTGLGLSQVYGFARQSGGRAALSSAPGSGTTVTLWLPRSHEAVTVPTPAVPVVSDSAPPDAGKVLAVEDNPAVAEACAAYLRQLGYEVVAAANSREALEALAADPEISILLSDILMPDGLNGVELAESVRRTYPVLPIVLTSGYGAGLQEVSGGGWSVLQKPYSLEALDRALRGARAAMSAGKPASAAQ